MTSKKSKCETRPVQDAQYDKKGAFQDVNKEKEDSPCKNKSYKKDTHTQCEI